MKHYLRVEVDTNDADYEVHETDITDVHISEINRFKNIISYMETEENYHYNLEGKRVVTGNIIHFKDNVGFGSISGFCGLKVLLVDEDEWKEGLWKFSEVKDEGLIFPEEYELLCKYLPMYLDHGFHSIIGVWIEERNDPVIIEKMEL